MRWGPRLSQEWVVPDNFGRQWRISIPPVTEQGTAPGYDWKKRWFIESLVFDAFDHNRARADHIAAPLIELYDALTHARLGDRLPDARRPSHDPRRILVGFDVVLRRELIACLKSDFLRVEEAPRAPWPFAEEPDAPVSGPAAQPTPDAKTTYVALRLVNQDGQAVPRRAVHLVLADKTEAEGFVDSDGRYRLDGVPAGSCKLTFSDLDVSDFAAPVELVGADAQPASGPVHLDPPSSGFAYSAEGSDTLSSVAERYDFLHFATIWSHSGNAPLRDARGDPHILLAGDAILVPPKKPPTLSVSTGSETTYVVHTQTLRLKLKVVDQSGNPITIDANTVQVDGADVQATVSGGDVDLAVPRDAKVVTFKVSADDAAAFSVSVGALPPLRETGGPEARLENLGHGVFRDGVAAQGDDADAADPDVDEQLELAVELHQDVAGQSPTGDVTDDTLTTLRDRAGA